MTFEELEQLEIEYWIKNNLYSKTTMMLKFIQNGKPIFIKIYPIKYDMFYKVLEDKKRKMFESLLQKLDN